MTRNNVSCSNYCGYRRAATLHIFEKWFVSNIELQIALVYVVINNNNNNNNEFNFCVFSGCLPIKRSRERREDCNG
jgi:hypothetical protein